MNIDVYALATRLAKDEFKKEYEEKYEFDALYERVSDDFAYYLNETFSDIFEELINKYVKIIESYPYEG